MQFDGILSILWYCLSLGLEWKLTFSSPIDTAEFSIFSGRTFTGSSFRIWNSSTGILSPPLASFKVMHLRPTWLHIPGCPRWLLVMNLPVNAGDRVWSLGGKDPLKEEMSAHLSILAWISPWTEEPGGVQGGRHNWATERECMFPLCLLSEEIFFLS